MIRITNVFYYKFDKLTAEIGSFVLASLPFCKFSQKEYPY